MGDDRDFDEVELPSGGTVAGEAVAPGGIAKLADLEAQSTAGAVDHAFRSGLVVGVPRPPGPKARGAAGGASAEASTGAE